MTTKFRTVHSKFTQASNSHKRRLRMSQSGVIIRRNAGQLIPSAYSELAVKNNPHGWGAAIVSEVEGKKQLELNSALEGMSLEDLQDTQKTFMDNDMVLYLCQSEAGLSAADLSPHILIATEEDGAEVPQIVAFIDGNFPSHAQKDSSHPPEYHLVNDILVPKFEGLFEMCDGDLDKIVEQLKKPHFKKEILLHSVSRGHITIMAANGACLTFSQPDGLSMEYPWGWVSNNYSYAAGAPKEEVKAKKPGLFQRGSRSTVREAAPSAAIADGVKPPATDTAWLKPFSVKREAPPANISRRDRKDWYTARIGYKPQGWEKGPAVDVFYENGKLLTFSQIKSYGLKGPAILALANNPEPEKGDTRPEHVRSGDTLPATTGKASAEVLPIMSPATRDHIKAMMADDKVKKIISENAEVINDPRGIEGLETKFADFARQLGAKTMAEYGAWSFEMMYDLAKSKPDGIANMCFTFRNLCAKNGLLTPKEEVVKEEVAAPEAVSAPPKKPGLFKRSAAA